MCKNSKHSRGQGRVVSTRMQYVIPAAGVGSRFVEASFKTIKPLIPVGGVPMILWPIFNLTIEPQDLIIIVTKKGDNLESIRETWLKSLRCEVIIFEMQELSEGPASTVEAVKPELIMSLPLIVLNSDQYVSTKIENYISELRNAMTNFGSIVTMLASSQKWSYIGRDSNDVINQVIEKVEISSEATVGIYGWSKAHLFFDSLEMMKHENLRVNNEFYVAPTFNYLIQQEIEIRTFDVGMVGEAVHGLGTPMDLEEFLVNPVMLHDIEELISKFK